MLSIGVVVRLNKVYHFTDIVFIKRQIGALKGFLSSPPFLFLKLGEEKTMVQVIPCSLKEWQARYRSGAFAEDPVAFGYDHYECSLESLRAKNAFLGPLLMSLQETGKLDFAHVGFVVSHHLPDKFTLLFKLDDLDFVLFKIKIEHTGNGDCYQVLEPLYDERGLTIRTYHLLQTFFAASELIAWLNAPYPLENQVFPA